jgi:hypothetical protein
MVRFSVLNWDLQGNSNFSKPRKDETTESRVRSRSKVKIAQNEQVVARCAAADRNKTYTEPIIGPKKDTSAGEEGGMGTRKRCLEIENSIPTASGLKTASDRAGWFLQNSHGSLC